MAEVFLGSLLLVPYDFEPRGWAFCNGQTLRIAQYTALFSLLGTTYGGDGVNTFALPDLRGRVPVSSGQGPGLSPYVLGEQVGVESVQLTVNQIPSHNHTVNCNGNKGNKPSPSGNFPAADAAGVTAEYSANDGAQMNTGMLTSVGGNQGHENRQPSLTMNWIIALVGIFPSRS
jgi:microcystin-dependent protein